MLTVFNCHTLKIKIIAGVTAAKKVILHYKPQTQMSQRWSSFHNNIVSLDYCHDE